MWDSKSKPKLSGIGKVGGVDFLDPSGCSSLASERKMEILLLLLSLTLLLSVCRRRVDH